MFSQCKVTGYTFFWTGLHKCVYGRNLQAMAIYMQPIMLWLYISYITQSDHFIFNQWRTAELYIYQDLCVETLDLIHYLTHCTLWDAAVILN